MTDQIASSRIAVVVASCGRPFEIGQLLGALRGQTLPPSAIVISVHSAEDLPAEDLAGIQVVMSPKGSCVQRNRGLDRVLAVSDVVVFYDDDFLPAPTALAGIASLFAGHPRVVGATGLVLRDGIGRGGISYDVAREVLRDYELGHGDTSKARPIRIDANGVTYGCNMAFRCAAVGDLRFDENLPLYGWQEDIDFSARLGKKGEIVKTDAFAGVHLGVFKGRISGVPLGYSQMVNPIYLTRKGSVKMAWAARLMAKNFAANHIKMLTPEPYVDRMGRVRGNWRGLWHMMRGRVNPAEILKF